MEEELKNFGEVMRAYLEAQKNEVVAKDRLQKTRYHFMKAWEGLSERKRELLEEGLRGLNDEKE